MGCPELGASHSDASTLHSSGVHSDRWNVQAAPSRTLQTLRLGELWRAAIVCSWHNKKVKEDIGSRKHLKKVKCENPATCMIADSSV